MLIDFWALFVSVFWIVTVHFFRLLALVKKKLIIHFFCSFALGPWTLDAHAQVDGELQEHESFLSIINRQLLKNISNFLP